MSPSGLGCCLLRKVLGSGGGEEIMDIPGLELDRFFPDIQNLFAGGEQKQTAPPPVIEDHEEPVRMGVGLIRESPSHATPWQPVCGLGSRVILNFRP